jgi:hypothetical protein
VKHSASSGPISTSTPVRSWCGEPGYALGGGMAVEVLAVGSWVATARIAWPSVKRPLKRSRGPAGG